MTPRLEQLLKTLVEQHIETGQPVGSNLLEKKTQLGLSSATIRNELAILEEEGYIFQPHTSAGRIPTEKGYRYYVDHLMIIRQIFRDEQKRIDQDFNHPHDEHRLKQTAKSLADLSGETIILGLSPNNFFYTGLANLFQKPEFHHAHLIVDISEVLDHFEEVVDRLYPQITDAVALIGSENPFHAQCSFIGGKFSRNRLIGILGPLRMDYASNLSLIQYLTKKL